VDVRYRSRRTKGKVLGTKGEGVDIGKVQEAMVTITDSSPDSITEIPQALIGVVGLFGV
jgi:hypothetical protein